VLLYELLTGSTPFDSERLRTSSFDEVRRIIREEEPPRPSTRLNTPALDTVSARRNREPRKLSAFVRGDLDWIVMKALEKDRSRRYETADAFAQDVRRFLDEEPIEARPPSSLYRFGKFARRNRMVLTTGAVAAAALVLGAAVSVHQAVLARAAQAEANAARQKAEDFAERLKEANLLLDSARVHTDEERWAEAWADCTRAAELQPDHYLVWSRRGALGVRLGLWKRAADDYARAMDLGASANSPGWWGVPQLLLYAGDEKRYRDACTQLLQQQEKADPFSTAATVRSCLLVPASAGNPADLVRRAEKLLAAPPWPGGNRFFPGGGAPPRPFEPFDGGGRPAGPPRGMAFPFRAPGLYIVGLAHYRAGQYEQAVARLRSALGADPRWPSRMLAHPLLAMAHLRSEQAERAREVLAAAEKTISQWTDEMVQGRVGAMPVPWFDWLECLLLYREARILLGAAPPDDPRLRTIERRAESAVNRPGG
jgi:tetratricopeptide (TPR) repeat protein